MMISSNTSSNWETSCRLAPVTTSDNGTPRPSTNRCRLVPFFPPVSRIPTNRLLSQRCFYHGSVYALPLPGYSFHLVVFGKTGSPKSHEEARTHPTHEVGVDSTGTSESLLGQGLPLTPRSQNIHDGFKYLARWHWFSAPTCFTLVLFLWITLRVWYKGFNLFPKRIRYLPRLGFCHRTSMIICPIFMEIIISGFGKITHFIYG